MNLGIVGATDSMRVARADRASAGEDAPAFVVPEASQGPAQGEARRTSVRDGSRETSRSDRDADRPREDDAVQDDTASNTRAARSARADRLTHEPRDAGRSRRTEAGDAPEGEATPVDASRARDVGTAEPETQSDQAVATVAPTSDAIDLPTRMLALLGAGAAPVTVSNAGVATGSPMGTPAAFASPMAAAQAGPTGAVGMVVASAAVPVSVDAAGVAAGIVQTLPPAATPAQPAGADAFAALAALAIQTPSTKGGTPSVERGDTAALDMLASITDANAAAAPAMRAVEAGVQRVQFAAPIAFPLRPELGLDDAFDQRIVWMAEQRIGQAEMRVSPEGVGPIDVRLQMEGHRVVAQFNAANADVRQALEAGMDRLRDLLGQRGMELADAQVGRQRSQDGRGRPSFGAGNGEGTPEEGSTVTTVRALRARGLVDEYV